MAGYRSLPLLPGFSWSNTDHYLAYVQAKEREEAMLSKHPFDIEVSVVRTKGRFAKTMARLAEVTRLR